MGQLLQELVDVVRRQQQLLEPGGRGSRRGSIRSLVGHRTRPIGAKLALWRIKGGSPQDLTGSECLRRRPLCHPRGWSAAQRKGRVAHGPAVRPSLAPVVRGTVFALIVQVRTIPAPTLVTVAGEIDMLTAPQLRDRVLPLPDGDLVLDISRVRLCAAAGLRVMLDLQDRRARTGARLVLAAPAPTVRRVLCVTGLDKTLPVAASVEDAVALVATAEGRAAGRAGSTDSRASTNGHGVVFARPPQRLPRPRPQPGDA
jgi:anti-anti-sigma factor